MGFRDMDALLQSFVENGPAGCGCAIARKGEILYEGYFGYANKERKLPVTENTVYRQYSMTKIAIYTLCMMLFEKGKFLLDDPISEYFPEWRETRKYVKDIDGTYQICQAERAIQIRHIMSMSCGLPYGHMPDDTPTGKEIYRVTEELKKKGHYTLREEIRAVSRVPIAFEPGSHWLYGFGSELAAGLIEVITGMEIQDALAKYLFEPLEMKDTGMIYFGDIKERMAVFYEKKEDGTLIPGRAMMDNKSEPGEENRMGCPRLFSTVKDFISFTQMLANGGIHKKERIMGRKTIDLMRKNQLSGRQLKDFQNSYLAGYGYGLGVRTLLDPAAGGSNSSPGEFGWTGGSGTWASIDPSEGVSVVYMHQMAPNMERFHHLRVRACAYGCLD